MVTKASLLALVLLVGACTPFGTTESEPEPKEQSTEVSTTPTADEPLAETPPTTTTVAEPTEPAAQGGPEPTTNNNATPEAEPADEPADKPAGKCFGPATCLIGGAVDALSGKK